ncbi:protein kintoun-like [Apostichopus japonicus]|uniref:protein kintoun-like n=1 Tax=Stichopus japonicus TaxID=307972 RepID=UPI003AB8D7E2
MASNEALKDLDITNEELGRLQKALKDEKFRKMFVEYAEEISNPENRKRYEDEIAELERNRGMDVKFINPEPAFVLKTGVDGDKKAFINCCKNENIGKPESKFTEQNGHSGYQWSIPHSLSPSREDVNKEGKKCTVFDCVFHPDCFTAAEKDPRFLNMIKDTAMDGIEREFKVKLDRNNVKQLQNMKYKGRMSTTVIRTANSEGPSAKVDGVSALDLPYPYESPSTDINANKTVKADSLSSRNEGAQCKGTLKNGGNVSSNSKIVGPTTPQYTMTHRGVLDMQQFVNAPDARPSTRPQELVVRIDLPLLKSASGIQLDVFEKRLYLESTKPAAYRLDIPLPFPVDEDNGSAKFDKSKSCMVVTLPVQPPDILALPSFAPSLIDDKPLVEEMMDGNSREENKEVKEISPSTNKVAAQNENACTVAGNPKQENYKNSPSETKQTEIIEGSTMPQEDHELDEQTAEVEKDTNSLKETFLLPEFSFHQSDRSISVIMEVPSVMPATVETQLSKDGRDCWIHFRASKANEDEESLYGLQLSFPDGSKMGSVTYNVSSCNLVIVLHKEEGFIGELQSFQAGPSKGNLQMKTFTTQSSIEKCIDDLELDNQKQGKEFKETDLKSVKVIPSDDGAHSSNLDVEFEITIDKEKEEEEKQRNTNKDAKAAADSELSIDICSSSISEAASSSDVTPLSPHSLLKSSLKNKRQRSSKSVSFSDEVVVGTFVPFQGRKGRKKSPHIRRSKQKLKAPALETCSDSELVMSYKGGEDSEEDLWNIVPPRRAIYRQSSSESESDVLSSPKGKHKKSKGSRRRRKEKARKALMMEGSSEDTNPDEEVFTVQSPKEADDKIGKSEVVANAKEFTPPEEVTPSESPEISSGGDGDESPMPDDQEANEEKEDKEPEEDGEWTTVTKRRHHKAEVGDGEQTTGSHGNKADEDEADLDKIEHRTQSAVEFSNDVMFDLDD